MYTLTWDQAPPSPATEPSRPRAQPPPGTLTSTLLCYQLCEFWPLRFHGASHGSRGLDHFARVALMVARTSSPQSRGTFPRDSGWSRRKEPDTSLVYF